MLNNDYKAHLDDLSMKIIQGLTIDQPLPVDDIVESMIPNHPENRRFRDKICKAAKLDRREFDQAVRRQEVKSELGTVPKTASDLVTALAAIERIGCRCNGTIFRSGPTKVRSPQGDIITITDDHLKDHQMGTFAHIVGGKTIRFSEYLRNIRLKRDALGLPFTDTQIADAADHWYAEMKRQRLFALYSEIAGPLDSPMAQESAETALLDLAKHCFDTTETSPEFVAAMLKKFIWQVKRKLKGLPVTDHLMVVLLGPQGSGKSTFICAMCSVLAEVLAKVDFKQISDDRNIDIWTNFIMFIDEMGYATKTDVDVVKNIITSETLARRPMRTNMVDTVAQNATFIGASNKELRELVRDPTGARRFVGLRFRADAAWALINHTAWVDLWRLVDADAEDPAKRFRDELKAQQEQSRFRSPVESWADQFERRHVETCLWDGSAVRASDLYLAFRAYEEVFHPGKPTSMTEWGTEMTRLIENQSSGRLFEKFRNARGNCYRHLPSAGIKKMVLISGAAAQG
jgi:energy-coupling factor transporter ATP-binding protein EcfA2